ncbi:NAD(+) synthase [bacterium]|nr:NAD(+) synthase [bacterium]
MAYEFNVEQTTKDCIQWIRDFFNENGPDCRAVIGISGGKDSTIAAKLCIEALGVDRVYGVLMPNGYTEAGYTDMADARAVAKFLGIEHIEVDIKPIVDSFYTSIKNGLYEGDDVNIFHPALEMSAQTQINLPPRVRMSMLYAISQSVKGRVVNTCNLSEDWVGYSTRYGDSVGDFSPLSKLTVTEIKKMGSYLCLPERFVYKTPSDGLCGKTDEDNLGFTYAVLDEYIRTGKIDDIEVKSRIDNFHNKNLFKLQLMPCFETPTIRTNDKPDTSRHNAILA